MKSSSIFLSLTLVFSLAPNFIFAKERKKTECPDCTRSRPQHQGTEATQEINLLAQQLQNYMQQHQNQCGCPQGHCNCAVTNCTSQCQPNNEDNALQETVLSNFAQMVQSFFNIVQNPNNGQVVGTSVAQMLSGLVNVALQIMKRLPTSLSLEEREEYLDQVDAALKTCVRSLAREKKRLKLD